MEMIIVYENTSNYNVKEAFGTCCKNLVEVSRRKGSF